VASDTLEYLLCPRNACNTVCGCSRGRCSSTPVPPPLTPRPVSRERFKRRAALPHLQYCSHYLFRIL